MNEKEWKERPVLVIACLPASTVRIGKPGAALSRGLPRDWAKSPTSTYVPLEVRTHCTTRTA